MNQMLFKCIQNISNAIILLVEQTTAHVNVGSPFMKCSHYETMEMEMLTTWGRI